MAQLKDSVISGNLRVTDTIKADTVQANYVEMEMFDAPEATTSEAGLMSAADKTKLNGIAAGAQAGTVTSVTLKAGTGISLDTDDTAITSSGTRTITNSGVRSIATGTTNGTISVNTNGTSANVVVKGLGSNAYTSTAYAPLENPSFTKGITYATKIHGLVTGTGTEGQAGSSEADYIPAKWTFDLGFTPVAGDIIIIKIPVAGVNAGVWISVDNGTTYHPSAINGATMLTTQYAVGSLLMLIYETGFETSMYGDTVDGGEAGTKAASYTMDRWQVLNFYNTNTTYSVMSTSEVKAGTASSSRVIQARYLSAGLKQAIVKGTSTGLGEFTVYGTEVNTLPCTTSDNGKFLQVVNGAPAWVDVSSASGVSF